ncbi:MAG: ABC transporter permease [Betaproteobacteria bacterium]
MPRRSMTWLEDARRDITYTLRSLQRAPAFAAIVVLTLAVGIGATTAVFSLLDGLLLCPLPVSRPSELVLFGKARNWGVVSGVSHNYDVFSYPEYLYFRGNDTLFPGGLAAFSSWQSPVRIRWSGEPVMARGKLVTGNYFSVFGVPPALGRVLSEADDRPEAAPVAVLSYRYWTSRFGRDLDVVDRRVEVNGTAFTVVGVAARDFSGETLEADPAELWFPAARFSEITLKPSLLDEPEARWMFIVGRAAPGARLDQITAGLTLQLHQWLRAHEPDRDQPDVRAAIDRATIEATPGATGISHLRSRYTEPLEILLAIAVLVLAIACANVANLLLARARAREGEMAMRLALGADRRRLLRQLLTESLLLSTLGGVSGVLLAYWATDGLLGIVFRDAVTYGIRVSPDLRIGLFVSGVVAGAGLLFGSAPAWLAARQDLTTGMKTVRTAGPNRRAVSVGRLLVAGQVAMSLLLIVGAALLVRSLVNLSRQDFGFDTNHVLVVHLDPRTAGYAYRDLAPLYDRVQQELEARPGVRSSAFALYTPLSGDNWAGSVAVSGFSREQNRNLNSSWVRVTPGYFATMGIPLLLGRRFGPGDETGAPHTAIVNESFVRAILRGEDPIGRRFGRASTVTQGDWEIVGVVKDTKHTDPRAPGTATYFLPISGGPAPSDLLLESSYLPELVVRADGEPAAIAAEVREALRHVDGRLVATRITTMRDQVRESFDQQELLGVLSVTFGAVALLLASIGLYGLMAYSVVRRTGEIAVRMALGAGRLQVVWMVVRELLALVLAGVAVGVPLTLMAARLVRAQLFGVTAVDPASLALATLALALVAAAAGFFPARRAARLDPASVLRDS